MNLGCVWQQKLTRESPEFQIIDDEMLQERCHVIGTYFLEKLRELRDDIEIVGDVRGKGLMIGVELVRDKVRKTYIL